MAHPPSPRRQPARLVPLSIWRDPEFTTLSATAQWLWFALQSSPLGERSFDPQAAAALSATGDLFAILDAEVELKATKYRLAFIPRRARPAIPKATRLAVYARDMHRCRECSSSERLSLDHIWPYSLGGDDSLENLQTLCIPCNSRKGARV